ncbi:MAG: hypothetical protein ABSF08_01150 [Candidatus Cybelea sp.]
MRSLIRYPLIIGVAVLLAACGGSQPPAEPAGTPLPPVPSGIRPAGWLSPGAKSPRKSEPVIYVADQDASEVVVYPETGGAPIGEITDGVIGPYGLFVDKNGTLYVANESADTVTAYPAGSTTPSTTWSEDLDNPHYPLVDANGDLFVSNQGNGTVVEYRSGSSSAAEVLQTQGTQTDGMDFDSQGDLYVAFRTGDRPREGGIELFKPGSSQGKVLRMKLNEPQGLIVDSKGRIVVVETGEAHRVNLFRDKNKRWAFQRIPAPAGATLTQLAIKADESELFASAWGGSVFTSAYPFPVSGSWSPLLNQSALIQGIALSNGQTF